LPVSAALTVPRAASQCRLLEWKPRTQPPISKLLGHCAIAFSGGWVIIAIPIFRDDDGNLSAGVPAIPQLDAEGRVRQRDGRRDYKPVIGFESPEARARWQRMVLAALAAGGIGSMLEATP
jgi:hypothetical protein